MLLSLSGYFEYMDENHSCIESSGLAGHAILRAFTQANESIVTRRNLGDTPWWSAGTCTFLGGVLLQLDTSTARSPSGPTSSASSSAAGTATAPSSSAPCWQFVCASVGDCKAFLYRPSAHDIERSTPAELVGEFRDITESNRTDLRDASDCGGRMGPFLSEGRPDLRNLQLYSCDCREGDYLILVSDGVHDNLDLTTSGVHGETLPVNICYGQPWEELAEQNLERAKDNYLRWKAQQVLYAQLHPPADADPVVEESVDRLLAGELLSAEVQSADGTEPGSGTASLVSSSSNVLALARDSDDERTEEASDDERTEEASDLESEASADRLGARSSGSVSTSTSIPASTCTSATGSLCMDAVASELRTLVQRRQHDCASILEAFLRNSLRNTHRCRSFMETNPGARQPTDYYAYPGKMDHTTCVCVRVGVVPESAVPPPPMQAPPLSTQIGHTAEEQQRTQARAQRASAAESSSTPTSTASTTAPLHQRTPSGNSSLDAPHRSSSFLTSPGSSPPASDIEFPPVAADMHAGAPSGASPAGTPGAGLVSVSRSPTTGRFVPVSTGGAARRRPQLCIGMVRSTLSTLGSPSSDLRTVARLSLSVSPPRDGGTSPLLSAIGAGAGTGTGADGGTEPLLQGTAGGGTREKRSASYMAEFNLALSTVSSGAGSTTPPTEYLLLSPRRSMHLSRRKVAQQHAKPLPPTPPVKAERRRPRRAPSPSPRSSSSSSASSSASEFFSI
jgi:hypothetical protein